MEVFAVWCSVTQAGKKASGLCSTAAASQSPPPPKLNSSETNKLTLKVEFKISLFPLAERAVVVVGAVLLNLLLLPLLQVQIKSKKFVFFFMHFSFSK